jgi:branched-chain amino acid transport system substrate-binding protein
LAILAGLFAWNKRHYASTGELKVGAIFDLTGSLSYMGQWSLEGAKLAESEINSKGGVQGRQLRLVIDDAETNPEKAVSAFTRMIGTDEAKVVLGFNASSEVMAVAPIANRSHVVLFSTGGASPGITDAGDYVFRNRLSGAVEAARMAEIAYNTLGARRCIVLFINNEYGQGYAEAFRTRFTGLGGSVTFTEGFAQDQTDFRAQLEKVRSAMPVDFIYLASHTREAGGILKQARQRGLHVQWLASNAVEAPDLFEIAGDAAEGMLFTVEKVERNSPAAETFITAYKKKYGREPEMFAAHAYDAVRIIAQILEQKKNDGSEIRDALYGMTNYPGASGMTSFDKNGDVVKEVALKRVHGNEFQEISENLVSHNATTGRKP